MQKWTRSHALSLIPILNQHTSYEEALAEIGETKDALYNAFKRFGLNPPSTYLGKDLTAVAEISGWQKIVVTNDHHVPFHNKRGVANVLRFVTTLQPDQLVFNGDFLDCYSISDFDRAPGMPSLQDEIDEGVAVLKDFRDACPSAKMVYMEGNHEQRLERIVMRNPGLYGLKSLTIPSLLNLAEMNISHLPYKDVYKVGPLAIKHGEAVRATSGQTVRSEMNARGFNQVIIGHVHRMGWVHHRGYEGYRQGLENGGLFDIGQCHYNKNPDWQNGFCVAHVNIELGKVHIEPIFMDPDGSFYYGGIYYAG